MDNLRYYTSISIWYSIVTAVLESEVVMNLTRIVSLPAVESPSEVIALNVVPTSDVSSKSSLNVQSSPAELIVNTPVLYLAPLFILYVILTPLSVKPGR